MVEVQMRVDDDVDPGEIEILLAQRDQAGIEIRDLWTQLRHTGIDKHTGIRMVDDVDVDRPPLALDEQLGHEHRCDRGRRWHPSSLLPPTR